MDELTSANVKATFYVDVGKLTNTYSINAIRRAFKLGHTIGLMKTWSNNAIQYLDSNNLNLFYQSATRVLANVTGVYPMLAFLSSSDYNATDLDAIKNANMIPVGYSLDTLDWNLTLANSSYTDQRAFVVNNVAQVLNQDFQLNVQDVSSYITIQQDGLEWSANAIQGIVSAIRSSNFSVIGMGECIGVNQTYIPVGNVL